MSTLISLLILALDVYWWILLAYCILSFLPKVPRYHPIVRILVNLCEPVLQPIRKIMPNLGAIDISPIIAVIAIRVIQAILSQLN